MKHQSGKGQHDNLVLGKENEFAYNVVRQAFEAPCESCNPMFLTAGTGNGKTYLMTLGMALAKENHKSVKMISATQFQEMLCQMIRKCNDRLGSGLITVTAMYEEFSEYDIVIIENLESLDGMEATLDWVVYFLDYLVGRGKQVFVTSSKRKKELMESDLADKLWKDALEVQIPELSHQFKLYAIKTFAKKFEMELDINQVAAIAAGTISLGAIVSVLKQIRAMSDLAEYSIKEAADKVILEYL